MSQKSQISNTSCGRVSSRDKKSWCDMVMNQRVSEDVVNNRIRQLRNWGARTWPKDGCFDYDWLEKLVRKIDKMWFENKLMFFSTYVYGGLNIHLDVDEKNVAGYVVESTSGKDVHLHMNRRLFRNLFQLEEHGYHSGGVLCKDTYVCMLYVVLHELLHLALTICDRLGFHDDTDHHGPHFQVLLKSMYGQTDVQHGLIPGLEQYHDLDHIKSRMVKGTVVDVFIKGKWKCGEVHGPDQSFVKVRCEKRMHTVHPGLIRLCDETPA